MNTRGVKKEFHGQLLLIREDRSILPRENGKSRGPEGVGIFSADPNPTVVALFGSQTASTMIDEGGGFIECAERDDPPSRRIDPKRSLRPIGDASVSHHTAGQFFLCGPPERRG